MSNYSIAPQQVINCPSIPITDEMWNRLCDFYQKQQLCPLSGIWAGIYAGYYTELDRGLRCRDINWLKIQMPRLYEDKTVWGLDCSIANGSISRPDYSAKWCSILIAAANALGTLSFFNPEQDPPIAVDAESVLAGIENHLGIKLSYRGGCNMLSVQIGDRIISAKLIEGAYKWATLSRFLKGDEAIFFELGAGSGTFGAFLTLIHQAQLKPCVYHTIDLPIASVIQAYLLSLSFGEHSVWLDGEPRSGREHIFVHGLTLDVPEIDVAINQDSLPEITRKQADDYVKLIFYKLRPGGLFYSANQESHTSGQTPVYEVMKGVTAARQLVRCRFMPRRGYVEEIWQQYA